MVYHVMWSMRELYNVCEKIILMKDDKRCNQVAFWEMRDVEFLELDPYKRQKNLVIYSIKKHFVQFLY